MLAGNNIALATPFDTCIKKVARVKTKDAENKSNISRKFCGENICIYTITKTSQCLNGTAKNSYHCFHTSEIGKEDLSGKWAKIGKPDFARNFSRNNIPGINRNKGRQIIPADSLSI
jgi:hypothetical protein